MGEMILLPFDRIDKGSKAAIYGAGDVGKHLLAQIEVTNWCDIICFVDKRAGEIQTVENTKESFKEE